MAIVSLSPHKFVGLPCFFFFLNQIVGNPGIRRRVCLAAAEVDIEFCWGRSVLRKFIGLTRKHTHGHLSANHKLTFYLYEEESRLNTTTTFSSLQFDIYHHLDRRVSDVDDKVNHETRTRRSGIDHWRHDCLWAGRWDSDTWQGRAMFFSGSQRWSPLILLPRALSP